MLCIPLPTIMAAVGTSPAKPVNTPMSAMRPPSRHAVIDWMSVLWPLISTTYRIPKSLRASATNSGYRQQGCVFYGKHHASLCRAVVKARTTPSVRQEFKL